MSLCDYSVATEGSCVKNAVRFGWVCGRGSVAVDNSLWVFVQENPVLLQPTLDVLQDLGVCLRLCAQLQQVPQHSSAELCSACVVSAR